MTSNCLFWSDINWNKHLINHNNVESSSSWFVIDGIALKSMGDIKDIKKIINVNTPIQLSLLFIYKYIITNTNTNQPISRTTIGQ